MFSKIRQRQFWMMALADDVYEGAVTKSHRSYKESIIILIDVAEPEL